MRLLYHWMLMICAAGLVLGPVGYSNNAYRVYDDRDDLDDDLEYGNHNDYLMVISKSDDNRFRGHRVASGCANKFHLLTADTNPEKILASVSDTFESYEPDQHPVIDCQVTSLAQTYFEYRNGFDTCSNASSDPDLNCIYYVVFNEDANSYYQVPHSYVSAYNVLAENISAITGDVKGSLTKYSFDCGGACKDQPPVFDFVDKQIDLATANTLRQGLYGGQTITPIELTATDPENNTIVFITESFEDSLCKDSIAITHDGNGKITITGNAPASAGLCQFKVIAVANGLKTVMNVYLSIHNNMVGWCEFARDQLAFDSNPPAGLEYQHPPTNAKLIDSVKWLASLVDMKSFTTYQEFKDFDLVDGISSNDASFCSGFNANISYYLAADNQNQVISAGKPAEASMIGWVNVDDYRTMFQPDLPTDQSVRTVDDVQRLWPDLDLRVFTAAEFSGLTHLYLQGRGIDDIKPLNQLSNLVVLDLSGNEISDISSLADNNSPILKLNLDGNKITSLAGEGDFYIPNTVIDLGLSSNQIADLPALDKDYKAVLMNLDLSNNLLVGYKFNEMYPQEDDEVLALTGLNLAHNTVNNIGAVERLTAMNAINLSFNHLANEQANSSRFTPLSQLVWLNLSANSPRDLEGNLLDNPLVCTNLPVNPTGNPICIDDDQEIDLANHCQSQVDLYKHSDTDPVLSDIPVSEDFCN